MIDIQLNMFCLCIVYGAGMGITYDVVRMFRRIVSHKNFFIGLEDFVFWVIWAIITVDGIHVYNSGELRVYVFLGIVLGIVIYIYTIGWVIRKILSYMLCFGKKDPQNNK